MSVIDSTAKKFLVFGLAAVAAGLAPQAIGIMAARGAIKGFGEGLAKNDEPVSSSGNKPVGRG